MGLVETRVTAVANAMRVSLLSPPVAPTLKVAAVEVQGNVVVTVPRALDFVPNRTV